MNDQLQELLKRVYEEGVEKANSEAERILEKAKQDAETILKESKQKAEALVAEAEKRAQEISKNTEADLKMASNHTVSFLKQKITDLVLDAAIDNSTKESFKDADFVKKVIIEAMSTWKSNDCVLTIAESLSQNLDSAFKSTLPSIFKGEVQVQVSPLLKQGFSIGPQDGSYKLSFTDEDFASLFKNYLRPRTAKILFG